MMVQDAVSWNSSTHNEFNQITRDNLGGIEVVIPNTITLYNGSGFERVLQEKVCTQMGVEVLSCKDKLSQSSHSVPSLVCLVETQGSIQKVDTDQNTTVNVVLNGEFDDGGNPNDNRHWLPQVFSKQHDLGLLLVWKLIWPIL